MRNGIAANVISVTGYHHPMQPDRQTTSLQPAALLHYRPFRDTSLIIDLFTLEYGRVSMIARGARSSKPVIRALYQPFRNLLVSWLQRDGLHLLVGIEERGPPTAMTGEPLICAYYLNELLMRLVEREQPMPALCGHYLVALERLECSSDSEQSATALRLFELQLLDALGLLPDFDAADTDGHPIDARTPYRYDVERRAASAGAHTEAGLAGRAHELHDGGNAVYELAGQEQLSVTVSGQTLMDLARGEFSSSDELREGSRLLKRLLRLQLGDAPLNSRNLFREFRSPG